tara:strand:+ start:2832 stop:3308 length:477 start_codon:yes stop_codon:yes gene_type:complete
MNLNQYAILKAATNIISGVSIVTLICLGVAYISFKNAFVFQDIKIEITNNPITNEKDIEFFMVGYKKHECNSTAVYGIAYAEDGSHMHKLDSFTKQYIRNTRPGEEVPNSWTMEVPADIRNGGRYRVSMTGEFKCNYLIFTQEKSQTFDNILLIVEPR